MANKRKAEAFLKLDFREILTMTEIYSLITLGFFSVFSLVFFLQIDEAYRYLFLNAIAAIAIISISTIYIKLNPGPFFSALKMFYIVPVIYLCYMQVQSYIIIINPHLYDLVLIEWDRVIFGTDPTVWLSRIANPWLTEFLQTCYFLFYFLPIFHGVELYFRREYKKLDKLIRTIALGFFVSYLLYFFMPAIGPRFFLHDFNSLNTELPGVLFTNLMRDFVNLGGGIEPGSANPMAVVNRDCMPSGHTMMTLINLYLVFRHRTSQKWIQLIIGAGLIFSTVYLRYHYVVDLFAGAFFAAAVIYFEPKIRNAFVKMGFKNA